MSEEKLYRCDRCGDTITITPDDFPPYCLKCQDYEIRKGQGIHNDRVTIYPMRLIQDKSGKE